jgi:hypothetical protein
MPTSVAMLVQVLIREESVRADMDDTTGRPVKGRKYAQGIVDVAQALLLIDKFGPKISLSSQGYACHALTKTAEAALDPFLLHKVIASDGEYSLNILRLVAEGAADVPTIGKELTARFVGLIDFKAQWATEEIRDRFSQRAVTTLLNDAARVFRRATEKEGATLFLKHTVTPRLEWLVDLGCIGHNTSGLPTVTPHGHLILKALQRLGAWRDDFVCLPLDEWLTSQLSLPNTCSSSLAEDFAWRLVASKYSEQPVDTVPPPSAELLFFVRKIYDFVKLVSFNEADALSIYEVLAAIEAQRGRVLHQQPLEEALTQLTQEYPGAIVKLSKRRGRGLYIALKRSA